MSEPNLGTGTWKGLLDQSSHAPSQDSLPLFYNAMKARPLVPLSKHASSTEQSWTARPPVPLGELTLSTKQSRESSMATSPAMSLLPACTPFPQYHNNYTEAFERSSKQASCCTLGIEPL